MMCICYVNMRGRGAESIKMVYSRRKLKINVKKKPFMIKFIRNHPKVQLQLLDWVNFKFTVPSNPLLLQFTMLK